jgi:hypothetical protein
MYVVGSSRHVASRLTGYVCEDYRCSELLVPRPHRLQHFCFVLAIA